MVHKDGIYMCQLVGEEGHMRGHGHMPKSHWHIGPRDVKYDTFDQVVSLCLRGERIA